MNYINNKQIEFCKAILDGCTEYEAYKKAGYCVENRSKSSVENCAKALMKRPKIKEYIDERRKELEKVTLMTREKTLIEVVEFTNECAKEFKQTKDAQMANAVYRGLDMRNRMLGYYAPEQVEHKGGITVNFAIPEPEPIDISEVIEVMDID